MYDYNFRKDFARSGLLFATLHKLLLATASALISKAFLNVEIPNTICEKNWNFKILIFVFI